MKLLGRVGTCALLGTIVFGAVVGGYAASPDGEVVDRRVASDAKKSYYAELYETAFTGISKIYEERDFYKSRVEILESAREELEKLVAGQDKSDVDVVELVEKLSYLKNGLVELFPAEDGKSDATVIEVLEKLSDLKDDLKAIFPVDVDGVEVDQDAVSSIGVDRAIQKLAELSEKLKVLFPCDDESEDIISVVDRVADLQHELSQLFPEEESDVSAMVEKVSHLKNELEELFSEEVVLVEGECGSLIGVDEATEKLSALKDSLLQIFPAEDGVALKDRIKNQVDDYEKKLKNKEKSLKRIQKNAKKLKNELKEITGYFIEIVRFVEDHKN